MRTSRWPVTYATLLVIASGCSGGSTGPGAKIVLYPILNGRGRITYVTRDPLVAEIERGMSLKQEREVAEASRWRDEQRIQEAMASSRRKKDAIDRTIQQLKQQSEELAPQLRRQREQPRWRVDSDLLRSREFGSFRMQQHSQAIDGALQELQKSQANYGAPR